MRIESKLCHISENKSVVQVSGWVNDKFIGTALAEAPTVEIAEDKAISRLKQRTNQVINEVSENKSRIEANIKKPLSVELPNNKSHEDINSIDEPCDWSNELTAIDSEIKRLNWSRDDEINFLIKTFGYNNRNKITKYNDIVNYLNLLKKLDCLITHNNNKGKIKKLIEESDSILMDLSWDHTQGRDFLQKEFNVSSRNELDENQLISFVSKLKSLRNQY